VNLAGLRQDAERRLRGIERALAVDALAGDMVRLDRRRYRRLCTVPVEQYVQPDEAIELHRSLLLHDDVPAKATRAWRGKEWVRLTVDRIGDCVRVWAPGGSIPIPAGDFVLAVVRGLVRDPGVPSCTASVT
jgi:hypothetical protein